MDSRFDVAIFFREHWHLLSWKGDAHAKGIYFDREYGYLFDRGFAVRMKHNDPAPSVFFVPGYDDVEDEVYTEYPYTNMNKVNRSFYPLFTGNELHPEQFDDIFNLAEPVFQFSVKLPILCELEEMMPVKRERDRAWIKLTIKGEGGRALVLNRQKEEHLLAEIIEIFPFMGCNGEDEQNVYINANTLLHVMKMCGNEGVMNVSVGKHTVKISNNSTFKNIEAVISMSKMTPHEIGDGPD